MKVLSILNTETNESNYIFHSDQEDLRIIANNLQIALEKTNFRVEIKNAEVHHSDDGWYTGV